MPTGILVIGIGNPIRGDDGLGWQVAGLLESRFAGSNLPVDAIQVQQLTMDLVDEINNTNLVVFIDAAAGEPVGQVSSCEISAGTALSVGGSHFFDPQTLLSAVQALYGTHPRAFLFSITTRSFRYCEELSPTIQSAIPGFVNLIADTILKYQIQGSVVS